jgi:hypothetical protein
MEVSLEQDFNATYNAVTYPAPTGIPWADFGVPYRGQPSVVYKAPFTVSDLESVAITDQYIGYGDPAGGPMLHPPDATITTNTPNSGASRLLLTSKEGQVFRLRVDARPEQDHQSPGAPGMVVAAAASSDATLTFIAPGDDMTGTAGLRRYRVDDAPIGTATSTSRTRPRSAATWNAPAAAGARGPQPVARDAVQRRGPRVRRCHNTSTITTATFVTAPRKIGESMHLSSRPRRTAR